MCEGQSQVATCGHYHSTTLKLILQRLEKQLSSERDPTELPLLWYRQSSLRHQKSEETDPHARSLAEHCAKRRKEHDMWGVSKFKETHRAQVIDWRLLRLIGDNFTKKKGSWRPNQPWLESHTK